VFKKEKGQRNLCIVIGGKNDGILSESGEGPGVSSRIQSSGRKKEGEEVKEEGWEVRTGLEDLTAWVKSRLCPLRGGYIAGERIAQLRQAWGWRGKGHQIVLRKRRERTGQPSKHGGTRGVYCGRSEPLDEREDL